DEFLVGATAECISNFWRNSYTGISRCNEVLAYIADVDMTDNARNQYTGEVKFLRAFHYFNLVRQCGGVPLRLEAVQSPDAALSKGRATAEEVYAAIIADLADAAEKLPANYTGVDLGRATEGAARTLLAKVYLTQKKYTEALTELRQVAALGYQLLPDYAAVFDPGNKHHAESIFEIQYLGSQTG